MDFETFLLSNDYKITYFDAKQNKFFDSVDTNNISTMYIISYIFTKYDANYLNNLHNKIDISQFWKKIGQVFTYGLHEAYKGPVWGNTTFRVKSLDRLVEYQKGKEIIRARPGELFKGGFIPDALMSRVFIKYSSHDIYNMVITNKTFEV